MRKILQNAELHTKREMQVEFDFDLKQFPNDFKVKKKSKSFRENFDRQQMNSFNWNRSDLNILKWSSKSETSRQSNQHSLLCQCHFTGPMLSHQHCIGSLTLSEAQHIHVILRLKIIRIFTQLAIRRVDQKILFNLKLEIKWLPEYYHQDWVRWVHSLFLHLQNDEEIRKVTLFQIYCV